LTTFVRSSANSFAVPSQQRTTFFGMAFPDLGSMVGFQVPERIGSITEKLKLTTRTNGQRGNWCCKQPVDDAG
jgi:hypothetical protein